MHTFYRLANAHKRVVFVNLYGGHVALELYYFADQAGLADFDNIVEAGVVHSLRIDDWARNPRDIACAHDLAPLSADVPAPVGLPAVLVAEESVCPNSADASSPRSSSSSQETNSFSVIDIR